MSESLRRFQVREFVRHWPFSSMPVADVERLAQGLQETYHPAGETVLQAGQPALDRLGWLRRGRLHAGNGGDPAAQSQVWEIGDCFPVGAFWAGQPLRQDHVAQLAGMTEWPGLLLQQAQTWAKQDKKFMVLLAQNHAQFNLPLGWLGGLQSQAQADGHYMDLKLQGIGLQDQQTGVWPEQALESLKSFLDDSPWMGFHAPFDQAFMARAARAAGVPWTTRSWLDLYDLRASLGVQPLPNSLDEVLRHAGIDVAQRHHAMADAWATAELWLYMWPRLHQQGVTSWKDVSRLARHARRLRRLG